MPTITDWIQAVSTVILVIVTIIYVERTSVIANATKEQAREIKEQRILSSRPMIIHKTWRDSIRRRI
jgi:hypothetical protein